MALSLVAVIVLSLLARSSSQEECGCCGLAKKLISDHDVPVEISAANPLLVGADVKVERPLVEIPENNLGNQVAWCSAPQPGSTAYNPYLTFKFNSTYLIEQIKISGDTRLYMFVRALTIQNDTGKGFVFINDNGVPKVFHTHITYVGEVRNISFMDRPVLATSLQIRPFNWTGNRPCMRIELYGCLHDMNKDSTNNVITDALGGNCTDDDDIVDAQRGVLITLGIGAALAGSLVTIAIILAAVGIVCCYRQIKKRKLLMPKERSSSMDSDATLRVVNNILYRKRRSDKRPLAPSTASTLVYETVPGEEDHSRKDRVKPRDGENSEEQNHEQEMPNQQQSTTEATPVYEIQYEPVKIDQEGLCMIQDEGEDMDNKEQCKLREKTTESGGTICSNHSYEIIKDREGAIIETSTESAFSGNEQGSSMDGDELLQQRSSDGGGRIAAGTEAAAKRGAKRKFNGAKNVMYENVSIALSPDTRHALFCESSGPQHFDV